MTKRKLVIEEETFKFSDYEINNLNDFINLIINYSDHLIKNKNKNKNSKLYKLPLILQDLQNLQSMIGLDKLKTQLLWQILYYLGNNESMLMNTVIYGPPGSGKTTVAKIMASIYSKIGILKKNKFKMITRADLIGQYLGETTLKTLKTLEECKDGVFFLDEAYSLGNDCTYSSDSYSKEAIDTINQYLLENKNRIICIIAGYKKEIETCFFNKNPGLQRRFPWQFTIDPYTIEQILEIFYSKLKDWTLSVDITKEYLLNLLRVNKRYIKNNGGDIDIILQYSKIKQTSRYLGKCNDKIILKEDLLFAFKELSESRNISDNVPFFMYT